jgi:hypothetical protein
MDLGGASDRCERGEVAGAIGLLPVALTWRYPLDMSAFSYRCPETGFRVESFASANPSHALYENVTCVACGRLHMVDPTTGNVAGEDTEQSAKGTDDPAA